MEITSETIKSWLDIAVQLLLLIVPAIIAWFIRTYVRSSSSSHTIAAITRLANSAIDYAENLDKRGDLPVTPGVRKGAEKLRLASRWLEDELARSGIKIKDADAQKWIAAEFQRRVGGVKPIGAIAELARAAVRTVQDLEQYRLLSPPAVGDHTEYLANLAADWLVAQLLQHEGASISREEALTWVRAEFLGQLQQQLSALSQDERLARLADGAAAFLDQIKASGRLSAGGAAFENDVAAAWLLTEAARQGLTVDGGQIVEALGRARQRQEPAPAPSEASRALAAQNGLS